MNKNRLVNLFRVARFIAKNPGTWLREIVRELDMTPGTVARCLKDLDPYIERRYAVPNGANLPNLPVSLTLKPGVSEAVIVRGLKLKRDLRR